MAFVPALSAEALLLGLQACGLDAASIRQQTGLASRYADPSELLPSSSWDAIWQEAARLDTRPELPTLAALQIPFGLFGTLDYLAGSAQTVRGGLQAVADHFAAAANDIELELHGGDGLEPGELGDGTGAATLRLINTQAGPAAGHAAEHAAGKAPSFESDEFTVSVLLGRFRHTSQGRFRPQRVYLTRAAPVSTRHAELFGAPVSHGAPRAGFDCDPTLLDLEQPMADERLHDTLREIAKNSASPTMAAAAWRPRCGRACAA